MSQLSRTVLLNLQTMAMAALLALLVWFYAWAQDTGQNPFPLVPLQVDAPPGVLIDKVAGPDGKPLETVYVTVSGSKAALRDVARRSLVCRLSLPEARIGDDPLVQEFVLGRAEFGLDPGLNLVCVPASVRVTLVKEGVQRMRVRTADCTTGVPRKGFRIADIVATPSFVQVRGPAAVVKKYREIALAKVDATDQFEDFSQVTDIAGTLDGSPVMSDTRVTLRFSLEEEEAELKFKLKVHILQPIDFPLKTVSAAPDVVGITVRGPQSELKGLDESKLILYADLFALYRNPNEGYEHGGTYKVPLKLSILDEASAHVRMVEHEEFKLEIAK